MAALVYAGIGARATPAGVLADDHGEAGQHRHARLEKIAVEIADQCIAAPARPDLGESDG